MTGDERTGKLARTEAGPMGLAGYLGFIGGYYRAYPASTALLGIATLFHVLFFTSYPVLFQRILDDLSAGADRDAFLVPIGLLLIAFGLYAVSSLLGVWAITDLATRIVERLRSEMLDALHAQPYRADAKSSSGDILSHFTLDLASTEESLIFTLPYLFRSALQVVAGVLVMFSISWQMTLVSLLLLPLTFLPLRPLGRRATAASATRKDADAAVTSIVEESVHMLDVITALQLRSTEAARLSKAQSRVRPSFRGETFFTQVSGLSAEVALQALIIVVIVTATVLVIFGSFSAGELVAFVLLLGTVQFSIQSLMQNGARLLRVTESGARMSKLVRRGRETSAAERGQQIAEDAPLTVHLDNVVANYASPPGSSRPTLEIDTRIDGPGWIGVTGASGSGKSTLLRLLMRQLRPVGGTVKVSGSDPEGVPPEAYFQHVTYLGQSPKLFNLSVAENLQLARQDATLDEIVEAARKADIHETIERLPQGYDTVIGEGGAALSGGQLQRVALARAILRGSPILLLDEPSSALDADAIEAVMKTVGSLRKSHLILWVSHRLTDHIDADHILVLEEGRLFESGTHDELVLKGGKYAALWSKQSSTAANT